MTKGRPERDDLSACEGRSLVPVFVRPFVVGFVLLSQSGAAY